MATHKSPIKAAKQTLKKTARNKSRMSKIRSFIKKLEAVLLEGNKEKAKELFKIVQSEVMRGVTKRVLKKNTASRKVSKLATKISKLA